MVSGAVVFPKQKKGEEADGWPIVFCFVFFLGGDHIPVFLRIYSKFFYSEDYI